MFHLTFDVLTVRLRKLTVFLHLTELLIVCSVMT